MIGRRILAGLALSMCIALPDVASAAAPPTVEPSQVLGDVGDVAIVGVDGTPITSGDGSTTFYIRLPDRASCPGDSANDQWRVSSFLLPVDEDPLDVQFGSTGPEPPWTANRWPVFAADTGLPIALAMLRRNEGYGEPGLVDATPLVSFRSLVDNAFPGGRYRLGMACSYFAQTTQYWDTEVVMGPGNGDPAALTWTLPNPTVIEAKGSDSASGLRMVLAAIGITAIAYVVLRRRADRRANPPSKEPS